MNVNEKIDRYLSEGKSKKFSEAGKWIKKIKKEASNVEKLLNSGNLKKAYGDASSLVLSAKYLVKIMDTFKPEDRGTSGLGYDDGRVTPFDER